VTTEKNIQPGRIWRPPDGAMCKTCTGPIAFKQLDTGKWCPVEVDGTDHWDICSKRQVDLGLRAARPTEETIGTSGPFIGSRKNLGKGVGVPWHEEHQEKCNCGRKWGVLRHEGQRFVLHCQPCKKIRIENTLLAA
jgi:hypothetical protein